jgi:hypothetical protein
MPPTEETRERRQSEFELDRLVQWREQVEKHIAATDANIKALQDERNHALKWGIITLGASVIGMGSWIFNFVTGHLK